MEFKERYMTLQQIILEAYEAGRENSPEMLRLKEFYSKAFDEAERYLSKIRPNAPGLASQEEPLQNSPNEREPFKTN